MDGGKKEDSDEPYGDGEEDQPEDETSNHDAACPEFEGAVRPRAFNCW